VGIVMTENNADDPISGITVICDSSNNTDYDREQNMLNVDITIPVSGYCACCGEPSLLGVIFHDPECIWYMD
jgi:hypothetical protein